MPEFLQIGLSCISSVGLALLGMFAYRDHRRGKAIGPGEFIQLFFIFWVCAGAVPLAVFTIYRIGITVYAAWIK